MRRFELVLGLCVVALPWPAGCERQIALGELDVSDVGRAGAPPLISGDGGEPNGAGGASEPTGEGGSAGPTSSLVFSSGFETGDLSEWGLTASTVSLTGGELSVATEHTHGGASALRVTMAQTDEQVGLMLSADYQHFVFGFWMRLEQSFESGSWVILNVDERFEGEQVTVSELFDLAIESVGDAAPRLYLWEKNTLNESEDGETIAQAAEPLPVGEWVHVELELRGATDTSGSLVVTQNGAASMDALERTTSLGGERRLTLGSFAHDITPLPAELWFDDVTLQKVEP